jgi:hypothetical protein
MIFELPDICFGRCFFVFMNRNKQEGDMRLRNTILMTGFLFAAGGANAAKQCMPCPAGKWGEDGKCEQDCEAGYYCSGGTKAKCGAGQNCPAGSESPSNCPAGFKCPDGYPIACNQGREYQDLDGQSTCKSCGNLTARADRKGCNQPRFDQVKAVGGGSGGMSKNGVMNSAFCLCGIMNEAGAWASATTRVPCSATYINICTNCPLDCSTNVSSWVGSAVW